MTNTMRRFWMWLRVLFTGKMTAREAISDIADVLKNGVSKRVYNGEGTLLWDGRLGAYRRPLPKIGRNTPCPCGRMRTAPGDITRRMKYKHCCAGVKNG
jgi:hypothetical protein